MGDPKKFRKKYSTPVHPWNAANIASEVKLIKEHGLKNKKEIWKVTSSLKKYKDLAKKLIAVKTSQGEKEKAQMIDKLQRLGLIHAGAELDDVLSLETKDLMERRLQTLIYRLGLARTIKQARQMIIHRHVIVAGKKITFPSYIVSKEEEAQIKFDGKSPFDDEEHPERNDLNADIKKEIEAIKPEKKKKAETKTVKETSKEDKSKPEENKEEVSKETKPDKKGEDVKK